MSYKFETLSIQNFRGIRHLSLPAEGRNLIIVGENGSGKSSVIDAVEYYFTGHIEKLTGRQDVKEEQGIPYLGGGPTTVSAALQGAVNARLHGLLSKKKGRNPPGTTFFLCSGRIEAVHIETSADSGIC